MNTIQENLELLQNTKSRLAEAIESKGQSITGVPLSQYSTLIDNISSTGTDYVYGTGYVDGTLTEIDLTGYTQIKDGRFSYCPITSVTIPRECLMVDSQAFKYCYQLEEVTIIGSPHQFLYNSFGDNSSHKKVYTTSLEDWLNNSYMNSSSGGSNPMNGGADLYINGTLLTDLVIPEGTTKITDDCFEYCNSLTSVSLPSTLTSIGTYCFAHCKNLPSITIPNSVTNIGSGAFSSCVFTEIVLPSGITSISNQLCAYCNNLTSVTIPNSVTTIEAQAFYSCRNLTSITIPSSVTNIGQNAIDIGKSASITCLATTPPQIASATFNTYLYRPSAIYVPAESVEAYKTASNWSTFADIIQAIP